MIEGDIKITSNFNLEGLIEKISTSELALKGKGYTNPQTGVMGLMIFVEGAPHEIIDIFIETKSELKKLGTS